jgi:hypothetical protein
MPTNRLRSRGSITRLQGAPRCLGFELVLAGVSGAEPKIGAIASVPEPSTYALFLMTAADALWMIRRRR